jgi:acyl carrier protein
VSEKDIKEIIVAALGQIAPEADLDNLRPDENIQEALEIDSYDFLNLLISLDEEIGVEVPESDYRQVATLDGLIHYMLAHAA